MKHIRSEKFKKLESELQDLEQWLKLGLVPKKDIEKHQEEIASVKRKIEEEKERLQFLRESGEAEEYAPPTKRPTGRAAYNEMPTIPDIDVGETMGGTDTGFEMGSEMTEADTHQTHHRDEDGGDQEERDEEDEEEEDESYFSDRNRWRRGGIVDPDANDW